MSKKTLALISGLIVVTILFVALAVTQNKKASVKQTVLANPTPTPFAQSVLTLSPNPATLTNGAGTVNVMLSTAMNEVTAVQLELQYDPKVITNVKVTPGSFFTNPLIFPFNKTDAVNGRVSYSIGIQPSQNALKGEGTVATISFSKVPGTTAGETQLTLLPKSLVSARGVEQSVLKSSQSTTVMLSAVTGQPSAASGDAMMHGGTLPNTQTAPATSPSAR